MKEFGAILYNELIKYLKKDNVKSIKSVKEIVEYLISEL